MQVSSRRLLLLASGAWLALAGGCSRETAAPGAPATSDGAKPPRVELWVFAATSTRDVLQALELPYEGAHPVDLVFNFGASGDLARQILAAGKADVFLSADDQEMDRLEQARLVEPETRRPLLGNQLVVVEPADEASCFTQPFEPAQLAGSGVRLLSLADPQAVPAGRYAREWLERRGLWEQLSGRVLPGVDVRAALAAVESGSAQAGIVYRTDAARSTRARIVFPVPLEDGPRIRYPAAALAGRAHVAEARALLDFLASSEAAAVFEESGFLVLPGASDGRR